LTIAGTPLITPFSVSINGRRPEGFSYFISLEFNFSLSSSIQFIFLTPERIDVIYT
jgi:hypothetical protein